MEWGVQGVEKEIRACVESGREGAKALIAVIEGEVVGYAVWGWEKRNLNIIAWARIHILHSKDDVPLPVGCNPTLRNIYRKLLYDMEAKHEPKEPFYELLELGTDPKYQRRGIGSQLMNYGLEKAERDDVKVFWSASPMGAPVYRKLGFEEVGRLEFPLEEYGGKGVHVHLAMVKEPGGAI